MKSFFILLLCSAAAVFLAAGCRTTVKETIIPETTGTRLNPRSNVYVAIPADAMTRKGLILDSGRKTALVIREAFGKYARSALIGRKMETFDEALDLARRVNCQYLVYPTVVRWEDHATEWSGVPDKAEIKIQVADCETGDVIHSATIKAAGPVMSSGDETPESILPGPLANYTASLFQTIHTPTALPKPSPP